MKKQKNIKVSRKLFSWAVILLLIAGGVVFATQPNTLNKSDQSDKSYKREPAMSIVSEKTTTPKIVPPMDKIVPPDLETASFGLG